MLSNFLVPGLIFISVVYNSVLTCNSTIKLGNAISRHPDRAPDPSLEPYPNDPYKNYNLDHPEFEQLTKFKFIRAKKMLLNFWVQGLILISGVYNPVLTDDSTIKFLSVIARHADRSPSPPLESYPNDPYIKYNFDPPGYGQLTKSGESRAVNLGLFLRNTYNDFLGSTYIPGSAEARSTDINRTIESVKLILEGLYPEAVVPIKSEDPIKDVLLFPQICPEYVIDYLNANEKPDVKEDFAKLKDFTETLCKWTGKNIASALDMYLLYTTLDAEKFMNLTLPSWTHGIYPDGDLLNGTLLEYKVMNYDEKMRKRNGGRLIKKLKEDMESIRSESMDENRKLMLYGVHDLNIVAVLEALGVFYPHVPKFSSAVIVELHLIEKAYYVKINYYLGVPAKIKTLRIHKCETLCPLDQFSNLMKNVIPSDLDLECDKLRKEPDFDFETDSGTVDTFKQIFSQRITI